MSWQPMATAPDDGTEILVYREDAGVFTALFVPSREPDDTPETGNTGEHAWFTCCGEDLTNDMPTHWMPLPAPPQP